MSKLDKIKEELGWLKVIFAISVATNLSLMAYLAKNYEKQELYFSIVTGITIIFITIAIVFINKIAYKKIDDIGNL